VEDGRSVDEVADAFATVLLEGTRVRAAARRAPR
jgi:hypothetical protein